MQAVILPCKIFMSIRSWWRRFVW